MCILAHVSVHVPRPVDNGESQHCVGSVFLYSKTCQLSFKADSTVAASTGARGAKKRKVSFTKDSDKSKAEATYSEQQQPETQDEAPVQGDAGQ